MSNSTLMSKMTQLTQTLSSQLLGQILLRKRYITPTQLETALAHQKNCPLTALFGIFMYSFFLQALLSKSFRFLSVRRNHAKCCKLGELLIQQGFLHSSQLEEALREQTWRQKGLWVI